MFSLGNEVGGKVMEEITGRNPATNECECWRIVSPNLVDRLTSSDFGPRPAHLLT